MTILSIDLETFSSVDIKTCGAYKYVASPDFEIILFGYAIEDGPVHVVDLATGEEIPLVIQILLTNEEITKTAYNANFERLCLNKHFGIEIPIEQFKCTAVHALTLGLPGKLEEGAKVLNMEQQKDTSGKALIRYFCQPCKPTKANGMRTRNLPEHAPEKWEQFKEYCRQDVVVERDIRKRLEKYPVPAAEHKLWCLDQKINDTGIRIDTQLVNNAIACDLEFQQRKTEEAKKLTGLENPNSVAQLKTWIFSEDWTDVDSLNKETVAELIKTTQNETVKKMLELRQEMAKTSVKKYDAMVRAVRDDERVRGLFQFYGANRTGRFAGRIVQFQNLPKNSMKDLDMARQIVRSGDFETLEMLFDSVPNVLSQLIRTAFIPSDGCIFLVSDFSAIEARVIAWLAGEQWRMEVFRTHGKIYEASASQMFHVPLESITKANPLRQKGKVAELALGYAGGPGALISMGALKQGLTEEELPGLVSTWRAANPAITRLWKDVEKAAISAVRDKKIVQLQYGLVFSFESGILFIKLPSGRRLAYYKAAVETDKRFNRPKLTYWGMDQVKKVWTKIDTYSGKLVENLVQAIARDCLAEALIRVDAAGYRIASHVHDEIVCDVHIGQGSLEELNEIMGQPISWAPGLPVPADGFSGFYYKKDD